MQCATFVHSTPGVRIVVSPAEDGEIDAVTAFVDAQRQRFSTCDAVTSGHHSGTTFFSYSSSWARLVVSKSENRVRESQDGKRDADALDRELDEALEETFPASDPIAVDTAETHEERHKDREQKKE